MDIPALDSTQATFDRPHISSTGSVTGRSTGQMRTVLLTMPESCSETRRRSRLSLGASASGTRTHISIDFWIAFVTYTPGSTTSSSGTAAHTVAGGLVDFLLCLGHHPRRSSAFAASHAIAGGLVDALFRWRVLELPVLRQIGARRTLARWGVLVLGRRVGHRVMRTKVIAAAAWAAVPLLEVVDLGA